MKIKEFAAAGLALLMLSGCAPKEPPKSAESAPAPAQSAPADVSQPEETPSFPPELLPAPGTGENDWKLADFPQCMDGSFPTAREEYTISTGTEYERSVTVLKGQEEGPAIYLVGGIHGDERAGWIAGNLLKEADLKAGTLYIVSPANLYGAEHDQRKTKSERDLNRNFPGNPDGWDAEQIAYGIYTDIEEKQPVMVFDLHEARIKKEGRDYLGNSIIAQSIEKIGDLVMDMLLDSEEGKLCTVPLTLYGSPPAGSINQTVTDNLGIPTITVETFRAEPLAQRVRNQLEIVEYTLRYFGMI